MPVPETPRETNRFMARTGNPGKDIGNGNGHGNENEGREGPAAEF
jgi:hypothetical protein